MKKVYAKLLSSKGESISEVLVASLVIALGALLVATMISASFRLLSREEQSYKEYIEQKNIFETLSETKDAGTLNITVTASNTTNGGLSRTVEVFSRQVDDTTTLKRYTPVELK